MRADTRAPSTSHENFPFLHANEGKECDTAGEKNWLFWFHSHTLKFNSTEQQQRAMRWKGAEIWNLNWFQCRARVLERLGGGARGVRFYIFFHIIRDTSDLSLSLHKTTASCDLYIRERIFECFSVVMFIYSGIKSALRSGCARAWGMNFNIENRSWSIRIWKRLRLATFWCRRARVVRLGLRKVFFSRHSSLVILWLDFFFLSFSIFWLFAVFAAQRRC